jgi:hypothetical protein
MLASDCAVASVLEIGVSIVGLSASTDDLELGSRIFGTGP